MINIIDISIRVWGRFSDIFFLNLMNYLVDIPSTMNMILYEINVIFFNNCHII